MQWRWLEHLLQKLSTHEQLLCDDQLDPFHSNVYPQIQWQLKWLLVPPASTSREQQDHQTYQQLLPLLLRIYLTAHETGQGPWGKIDMMTVELRRPHSNSSNSVGCHFCRLTKSRVCTGNHLEWCMWWSAKNHGMNLSKPSVYKRKLPSRCAVTSDSLVTEDHNIPKEELRMFVTH